MKGKKCGLSRTLRSAPNIGFGEGLQGAFEIGQGDVLVHHQTLDLVEHGRVGGVGVAPVGFARHDDVDGRPLLLHGAHLHRRGVCAQHDLVADEERVVKRPGRMIGGRVEGFEVVVLGLYLRAFDHVVTHADEDVLDLALGLGDQMQVPKGRRPPGQTDIHPLLLEPVHQLLGLQFKSARLDRGLQVLADEVSHLPHFGPLFGGKVGDGAQKQDEIGLPSQETDAGDL